MMARIETAPAVRLFFRVAVFLLTCLFAVPSRFTAENSASFNALAATQDLPPNVVRSIVEGSAAPEWLKLPPRAQVVFPSGVRLEVVSSAIVSHEGRKDAALVGMFRNAGREIVGASLTLSFVGPDGATVISSGANTAAVSEVPANGFLPFRFPLVQTPVVPGPAAILRVNLDEGAAPRRRAVETRLIRHSVRGTPRDGTAVTGEIEVASPEVTAAAGLLLTVLLLDKNRQGLDIVVGDAMPVTDRQYRFDLRGTMPVAKSTRSVQVWAEAPSR